MRNIKSSSLHFTNANIYSKIHFKGELNTMSYFYNKFLEASVADVIQTPDEVGNDLDAIEKAIEGNDGIEAHRDEVEDAAEGLIGDPVEECMIIMAEADHNFNMFMKELGIQELMEAAAGEPAKNDKDPSKAKAFFVKVGQWFQDIWEKIVTLIDNAIMRLSSHDFLKFVKNNETSMRAGCFGGTWKLTLHDMSNVINTLDEINKKIGAEVNVDMLKSSYGDKMTEEQIINKVTDRSAKSIDELTKKYTDIPEVEYSNNVTNSLRLILTIILDMGMHKEAIKKLKDAKAKAKKSYMDAVKTLKGFKDDDMAVNAVNNAMFATKVLNAMLVSGIRLTNMLYTDCYKAAKAFVAADKITGSNKPKKENKSDSTHENAYLNINII